MSRLLQSRTKQCQGLASVSAAPCNTDATRQAHFVFALRGEDAEARRRPPFDGRTSSCPPPPRDGYCHPSTGVSRGLATVNPKRRTHSKDGNGAPSFFIARSE